MEHRCCIFEGNVQVITLFESKIVRFILAQVCIYFDAGQVERNF